MHTIYRLLVLLSVASLIAACGGPAAEPQANTEDTQAAVETGIAGTAQAQEAATSEQAAIETGIAGTAQAQQPPPAEATTASPTETAEPTTAPPTPTVPPTNEPTTATETEETEPTAASPTTAPTAGDADDTAPLDAAPTAGQEPLRFAPDSDGAAQTTVNLQLVFDASGSMAEDIGGETRIAAARRAMTRVIETLPADNASLNVGFRVFGHRGDNTEAGRAESCQSTELLVPIAGVNQEQLQQQATAWEPTGWTPISLALQNAGEDFPTGENVRNVIIMVTDGEETCDGDPCAVAEALAASGAEVRIDLVGFGVTPEVADVLRCIPTNSGGVYVDAQDGDALMHSLEELISATIQRSTLTIQAVDGNGDLTSDVNIEVTDAQGDDVPLYRTPNEEAAGGFAFADGQQRIAVAPGTYTITFRMVNTPVSQRNDPGHGTVIYTAEAAEGLNTNAVVGYGWLTVRGEGDFEDDGSGRYRNVELQKYVAGTWEATLFQRFYPEEPFRLTQGSYRLVYLGADEPQVITNDITIVPGKAVEVQITAP
jgi:Mg-chelatase subunit ChlD